MITIWQRFVYGSRNTLNELARRNSAEVLNLVEETLDEISLAVECKITFTLVLAVGLGRNDRSRPLLREFVDESIGVVGLIGDDRAWVGVFEQRFSAGKIMVLPGGQHQGARIA